VADAFEIVAETVRVVVERVEAPLVTGVVVGDVADAVEQGIAQPDVGRGHVDFRAERAGRVGKLARGHAREEIEILGDGAVAVWRIAAGFVGRAAVVLGFLGRKIADVGLAAPDELDGVGVEGVEVVGGKKRF
jgi:hypothetical protein